MMKRRSKALYLFLLLQAVPAVAYSSGFPTGICTDNETWPKSAAYKYLAPRIDQIVQSADSAAVELLKVQMERKAKVEGMKLFQDYLLYRGLYQLKQVRLANQGFNQIVASATNGNASAVHFAALACLMEIRKKYPTLGYNSDSAAPLHALVKSPDLSGSARSEVYDALVDHSLRRIALGATDAQLGEELQILKGKGPWESVVRIALGSREPSEAKITEQNKYLKNFKALPPGVASKEDYLHVTLGQAYYGLHLYDRAIQEFNKIQNNSNYFPDALMGLSWSYLMKDSFSDAVGIAVNLRYGPLKNTFNPEAYYVTAIALNETCNFEDALRIVKAYRTFYKETWFWLKKWMSEGQRSDDLYSQLLAFLKKKNKLPERIGTEWVRSPVFLAAQSEINLFEEDRVGFRQLFTLMTRVVRRSENAQLRGAKVEFMDAITQVTRNSAKSQAELVGRINADLAERNRQMVSALNSVSENMQLIETELLSSLGDHIIEENAKPHTAMNRAKGRTIASIDKKKAPSTGIWDWGSFSSTNAKEEEWQDDTGKIREEIKNLCN